VVSRTSTFLCAASHECGQMLNVRSLTGKCVVEGMKRLENTGASEDSETCWSVSFIAAGLWARGSFGVEQSSGNSTLRGLKAGEC
jgi:hypothetical protein